MSNNQSNDRRQYFRSTFSGALIELKYGSRVARAGWNGKGMWLKLIPAGSWEIAPGVLDSKSENPCNPEPLPWIGMKTADGHFVPWLASQTDILADDWLIVE